MGINYESLSKVIAHALRHEPWLYEIELDGDGWAEISLLCSVLRENSEEWQGLSDTDVKKMVMRSSKKRYELCDHKIRALYGHSLTQKISYTHTRPPKYLFHGTSPDALIAISQNGLMPMRRQYVHLSVDESTAVLVGKRKSKIPVVLIVRALEAFEAGCVFHHAGDKVWLAKHVPYNYISQ